MEKVIWVITTIVLFVTVACVCYDRGKKAGTREILEHKEQHNKREVNVYNSYIALIKHFKELEVENIRLKADKAKTVKACRKYRERANLLEHNLNNFIDTYQMSEEESLEMEKHILFLAGQVEAYKKALPDGINKEK